MARSPDPPADPPRNVADHEPTPPISGAQFRAIAENTVDWENWHSPTGKLLWVNAAVQRVTGYEPAECLAMADYPLPMVAAEHHQRIRAFLAAAVAGQRGDDVEFQSLHRDGSRRWVSVSWQPMSDAAGCYLGFRSSVRDVTEKRRLREQLRLHNEHLEQLVQERTTRIMQLEKHRLKMERMAALAELAAGVAHEINNPLAGIRNAFSLFKSSLSPDTKYYEMLDLIDDEIERISKITHQMYQLYRPRTQQPTRFHLARTVNDVITLLEPMIRRSGVAVRLADSQGLPSEDLDAGEVVLREDEVKQVLFNLVRNAIQASQRGMTVQIELDVTATHAQIIISDYGCGIDEAVLPQIFDPFFSTKSDLPKQGMGLGLSVSRSLVEAMNGKITVTSRRGEGSRFTIELPRRLADPES
ncbi:sensor histidine kinase [Roseimaritima ulvae]|uniref:histidine kinase n=1 Tax=Roseimaritima ulvae TaxID=980254 RepID=A0A5B9QS88_9BACT|nr:ATP-binding protein [Roseimaritima ulvae]QEG41967.1 Sporulation kinase A [Roseimaritima ulvae]